MLQLFCWHLYKSEAGFSTVDFHGSGTSKVHVGISGISFGEHPLVSQAVETVATIAQVPVTFDIVPVLAYVQSLHTASISLHLLSSIALFLTVHSSISRVSCVDFPEDPDQTSPDQIRLGQTRLDLCPIGTLTAFFKVKSVNFVFYKLYTCVPAVVCDSW